MNTFNNYVFFKGFNHRNNNPATQTEPKTRAAPKVTRIVAPLY